VKLDNPLLVRWEYASEERLAKRNAIFRALVRGPSPEDVVAEWHFERVERREVDSELVFPTTTSLREFVAATIDRAHLAPQVPEIARPFSATARHAIFVAELPR
jgi:hypothetical protein